MRSMNGSRSENRVKRAAGRLNAAVGHGNREMEEQARRDLMSAVLEREILRCLNPKSPYEPMTQKERNRLARLLKNGFE